MAPNIEHQRGRFQRILFCTDFSDNAHSAFDLAVGQARQSPGCVLTLLHIIPEPDAQFWQTYLYEVDDVENKAHRDIHAKIEADYRQHLPPEIPLRVVIRSGPPDAGILEYATQDNSDLIVIGRQGSSSLGKVFFGNITEKIVRKSHCPVLIG